MANGKYVTYLRVSTAQQGASGLGIEAQRKAVTDYLNGGAWTLIGEFKEVESGKKNDRPKLAEAMRLCRLTGATLLIAKLDRLSRDAHFLLGLDKAGIDFVAADSPNANRMTVTILAAVAEEERRAISSRTKLALAAAKARGQVLGGWKGKKVVDNKLGTKALSEAADAFALRAGPMIADMRATGLSLAAIASELTTRGVQTVRGGAWSAMGVKNTLARYGSLSLARAG